MSVMPNTVFSGANDVKSCYRISPTKSIFLSRIMKNQNLNQEQRENVVKTLLDMDSDEFIVQAKSDSTVIFPQLQLFSKHAEVERIDLSKPTTLTREKIYSNFDDYLPANEHPSFVMPRLSKEPTTSINRVINQAKKESLRKSAAELKRQVREIELMKRQSLESNIKKTAFQKKLRCFRDRILQRLKDRNVNRSLIGNMMRCLDDSIVFEFLEAYQGHTMAIDDIICSIMYSVGANEYPQLSLSIDADTNSAQCAYNSLDIDTARGNPVEDNPGSNDWIEKYAMKTSLDRSRHFSNISDSTNFVRPVTDRRIKKSSYSRNQYKQSSAKGLPNSQDKNDVNINLSIKEAAVLALAKKWLSSYHKSTPEETTSGYSNYANYKFDTKQASIINTEAQDDQELVSGTQLEKDAITDHRIVRKSLYKLLTESQSETLLQLSVSQSQCISTRHLSSTTNKQASATRITKEKKIIKKRPKHVAILPTVPQIRTSDSNLSARLEKFNPFLKYRGLPVPQNPLSVDNACPADSMEPESYYNNIQSDWDSEPISPYRNVEETIRVLTAGVPSGAAIRASARNKREALTSSDNCNIGPTVSNHNRYDPHRRHLKIKNKISTSTAVSAPHTSGEVGVRFHHFNDSLVF